jgi:hypothetical protein
MTKQGASHPQHGDLGLAVVFMCIGLHTAEPTFGPRRRLSPLSVLPCPSSSRALHSLLWPLPTREHPEGDVHAGGSDRLRLADRFPVRCALRPSLRAAHLAQHWTVHASAFYYSNPPSFLPYTLSRARSLPPSPHSLSIPIALSAPPPAFRGNRSLNLLNGPPLLAILITTQNPRTLTTTLSARLLVNHFAELYPFLSIDF